MAAHVIGLTTRGDRFDGVLFTLLHECAHLTLRHITADGASIVDDDVAGEQSDPAEIEANDQAARWLFPDGFDVASTSAQAIVDAASRYGLHPSVVFGRVQWETANWSRYRTRIPKVRPALREAGMLS